MPVAPWTAGAGAGCAEAAGDPPTPTSSGCGRKNTSGNTLPRTRSKHRNPHDASKSPQEVGRFSLPPRDVARCRVSAARSCGRLVNVQLELLPYARRSIDNRGHRCCGYLKQPDKHDGRNRPRRFFLRLPRAPRVARPPRARPAPLPFEPVPQEQVVPARRTASSFDQRPWPSRSSSASPVPGGARTCRGRRAAAPASGRSSISRARSNSPKRCGPPSQSARRAPVPRTSSRIAPGRTRSSRADRLHRHVRGERPRAEGAAPAEVGATITGTSGRREPRCEWDRGCRLAVTTTMVGWPTATAPRARRRSRGGGQAGDNRPSPAVGGSRTRTVPAPTITTSARPRSRAIMNRSASEKPLTLAPLRRPARLGPERPPPLRTVPTTRSWAMTVGALRNERHCQLAR